MSEWDVLRRTNPWLAVEIKSDGDRITALRISWVHPPWDSYLDALRSVPDDAEVLDGLATWMFPIEGQMKGIKTGLRDLVEPGETLTDTATRLSRDMRWDQDAYCAYPR